MPPLEKKQEVKLALEMFLLPVDTPTACLQYPASSTPLISPPGVEPLQLPNHQLPRLDPVFADAQCLQHAVGWTALS